MITIHSPTVRLPPGVGHRVGLRGQHPAVEHDGARGGGAGRRRRRAAAAAGAARLGAQLRGLSRG